MAEKWLTKCLKRMQEESPPGITGGPCRDDNIYLWNALIRGPEGTPWEEGKFRLRLFFPRDYPFKCPEIRFISRMFHPNVYPDGSICMDILAEQYTPALLPHKLLLSIQSILDDPTTESPANAEAAYLYSTNRREYNRRVRAIAEDSLTPD